MCYCRGAECAFSLPTNACDGAVGAESIYSHTSKTAGNEETTLSFGSKSVSTTNYLK